MKSLRRANRLSGGTKAKIERIIKELRSHRHTEDLSNASGAKLFAVFKSLKK